MQCLEALFNIEYDSSFPPTCDWYERPISTMNSLFATSLSFGVRVLVDAVNPYSYRLGASVVGVCEGIILYNSRPGTSPFDPSLNPYVAYALRTVVDYLISQSLVRMAIILLWTGLGLVLSDIIEASSRDGRHRSTSTNKSRPTRVRKSRTRPSDAQPPLNDQPAVPDDTLPTDFPESIPPSISHPVPRPGDGALYGQELPSMDILSEADTYPDPFQGLPVLIHSLSSISDINSDLIQEFGHSSQLPVANRPGYTPPVPTDPIIDVAQPDLPDIGTGQSTLEFCVPNPDEFGVARSLLSLSAAAKEDEHTPIVMTTDVPAPVFPPPHNGDVFSPTKAPDPLVSSSNDDVEDLPSSIPTTDQHPAPLMGTLLTLAPDQTPVVPPIDVPISLIPDAQSIEESQPFVQNDGESAPPATNPTQHPSLSLIVPTTEDQVMTGKSSDIFLPTATENTDPLPIRIPDINIIADTSDPQLLPTPDDAQANPKKNSRWTRPTLTLKAREWREKAEAAFKESHRFEAERKQANQEGRKKDAILREGDRDEAMERAKVLSDKSTKYYYLGTLFFWFCFGGMCVADIPY
jgi:hypothetical protein